MSHSQDVSHRTAWQTYWARERSQPAYAAQGRLTAVLSAHWEHVFERLGPKTNTTRCLDIAAGNGDLSARLLDHLQRKRMDLPALFACDLSQDAARQLRSNAQIRAVRCDAARLPFANHCLSLIMSQFGIEYAGADAIDECARVAAPGGSVALAMHHREGALHAENQAILAAVEAFRHCELLPTFARYAGNEQNSQRRDAFIAAVKATEAVLRAHGPDIAGGALLHVYREVASLHDNLAKYDRSEVSTWCANMTASVESYAARTRWMIEVALTRDDLDQVQARLAAQGMTVLSVEAILDQDRPVAWSLIASRTQGA